MISSAAASGADAVKFQMIRPEELFSSTVNEKINGEELIRFFKKYSFPESWLKILKDRCGESGVEFLVTPFYLDAVDSLEQIDVRAYKVASFEMRWAVLLEKIKKTGKPVIVSAGMSSEKEICELNDFFTGYPLCIMHCVSLYPPEPDEMNLKRISFIRDNTEAVPGFSDHLPHSGAVTAAVALGARIIEKHFTLSKKLTGADHSISLEPADFRQMVEKVRELEKMLCMNEISSFKREASARVNGRRGIYAACDMEKGDVITAEKLDFLRPSTEFDPWDYKKLLGKKVSQDIKAGAPISRKAILI